MGTVNIRGLDTLEKNIRATMRKALNNGTNGLIAVGEDIMARSYEQCPKNTGTLADSGFVEVAHRKDDSVSVRIGYGGKNDAVNPISGKPASSYMVPVHERLDRHHPNGKAKFLEDPINEVKSEMLGKLAQKMR